MGRWAGRDDALDHGYVSSGFALDRAAKTLACGPRQTSGSVCTPRTQCQRPGYASWSANEAQAGRHTQSRIPRTPCGVPQLSGRPPGTGVLDSMHPWHCQAVPAHDKQTGEIVGLLIPRPSSASKRRRLPRPPAPTNLRGPASLPRHLSARLVARYAGDGCTSESCQGFGPVSSMSAQGQQADEVGARGSHLKVPPRLLVRIEAPRDELKLVPGHLW